jgi:hypothetical protein
MKIAATQKARWASLRRGKPATTFVKSAAQAKKKTMSTAARAKMSAKLKAYWRRRKLARSNPHSPLFLAQAIASSLVFDRHLKMAGPLYSDWSEFFLAAQRKRSLLCRNTQPACLGCLVSGVSTPMSHTRSPVPSTTVSPSTTRWTYSKSAGEVMPLSGGFEKAATSATMTIPEIDHRQERRRTGLRKRMAC